MAISLQPSLDGADKKNVKSIILNQSGKVVGRWGENGSDLDASIDVEAVETQMIVCDADGSKGNGNIGSEFKRLSNSRSGRAWEYAD